ncbi:MAG: uroporphyrinogen decarboxylase family protein [Phycisphaerae bacterium]
MSLDALTNEHRKIVIHRSREVGREEYIEYMTFERPGPPMLTELFGPLVGLKDEWRDQGASAGELDFSDFRYRQPRFGWVPVHCGAFALPEGEILSETDDEIIARDGLGRTMKLCRHSATLPLPLDFPVKTRDDWERLKPHYTWRDDRLMNDWQGRANELRRDEQVLAVSIPGGFDEPRRLLGDAQLCMAYYDQPELVRDMLQTFADTACTAIERVAEQIPVDRLFVHEDMAGKSGPLAGPDQVREFILPYYRHVWDCARSRGVRLFSQDSDGNMNPVVEAFLDAGVNVMFPNEPAAGMDIVALREQYGDRLGFQGGLDKHVLRQGKSAIDRELEYKIPPMVRTGGCVLGLDHRIPNGTPLDAYRYYLDKAWEILRREYAGSWT